ncbi:phosphoenolpyruvate carboxylase [Marinicella sp. W31]|uniref:phosphoenolpyruvate carboxylase n=1 Tax=Marinicella sp. W31 TaxID=3023713 RepID=UPI003757C733
MSSNQSRALSLFHNTVVNPYHIYNSLFLQLPFNDVYETGVLLPILSKACEKGYQKGQSPLEIMSLFFEKQTELENEQEQIDALFRLIQYIERQIVLFDSVEDAAYTRNHDMDGSGTISYLAAEAEYQSKKKTLQQKMQDYRIRVVLTAHPTQFYPGPVLGIMGDLTEAIAVSDLPMIEKLLQQLGKTPLFSRVKPTPYDEAVSLIWYLENIFYASIGNIMHRIHDQVFDYGDLPDNSFIDLGFWPGGDRDGNPFVSAETTLKVAARLKSSVLKCYYRDVRKLKRRLTFDQVDEQLLAIEQQLYRGAYLSDVDINYTALDLLNALHKIHANLSERHNALFVDEVEDLMRKVRAFGFHFATLDVRQDSRVHHQVMCEIAERTTALPDNYAELEADSQLDALANANGVVQAQECETTIAQDTLASIDAIRTIQQSNGEAGANRYIISNCQSVLNVMEVLTFFKLRDWSENVSVDIIPLFETIDDLHNAPEIMATLYQNDHYRAHLQQRGMRQTMMLGFSDGTKDGGYLAANWSILSAKEQLSAVSSEQGVEVVFFDGRGGPPARGGGETHKFYASLSNEIANSEIQLTIQGQTISCNFGTVESAQYNLEQLLSAGLSTAIRDDNCAGWKQQDRQLLEQMAETSLQAYEAFKKHPKFIPYLEKISTLQYYSKTNIGSRPGKRSDSDTLRFEDLRAIPFVGAWSQLKQNVLGYYGVGEALQQLPADALRRLYDESLFFKALMDNSMMSICKSFMPLTQYLRDDPEFGEFWEKIYAEFNAAQEQLKQLSGKDVLLADKPLRRASIDIREKIVLPLLTIQQYSLQRIAQLKQDGSAGQELIPVYEKLVTRSLYGNINASRNSV